MFTNEPAVTLIQRLEEDEAAALEEMSAAAPATAAKACGLAFTRVAGAYAGAASRVDVLAMNRVVGLGLHEVPSAAAVDEIVEFYRARGVPRFFVQVAPTPFAAATAERLASRGFAHHNNWVRLHRPVVGDDSQAAPPAGFPYHVERIGPERAAEFGARVAENFEWTPDLGPWLGATVGSPGWRHYLALDGKAAVGTALLRVSGALGWFSLASTTAAYRGRGVQSALISWRLRDAAEAACAELHVETAQSTADHRAPSYHNVMRQGFRELYLRKNYIWKREAVA